MRNRTSKFGLTSRSFVYSVAIHASILLLLTLSVEWDSEEGGPIVKKQEPVPVQATVVSEAAIQKELKAIQKKEAQKRKQEQLRKKKLKQTLKRAAAAEKKRKQEEKQLKALTKKRKQETKKAKLAKKKRKQEEQRLAKVKKQAAQHKKDEKSSKERKAERKRRVAKQEQQRREAELKAQIERDRRKRKAESEFAKYRSIIRQRISRNWIKPPVSKPGLEAHVLVRVTPRGDVLSARVIRSSGDPVFDRSVENAILKASPLPIPQDKQLYDFFREFNFKFNPDKQLVSQR